MMICNHEVQEITGERLLKRNFTPGFRIELHQKDLGLALEGARALGLSLPNTATCQELFNSCVANGLAKSDHAAMVSALELLANRSIASESLPSGRVQHHRELEGDLRSLD